MGIFNKIKPTTWLYLCLAIIGCVFVVNYLINKSNLSKIVYIMI